jgi:hypothetical protein
MRPLACATVLALAASISHSSPPPGSQTVTLQVLDAAGGQVEAGETVAATRVIRRDVARETAVPASFFAMSALEGLYPPMHIGTLAHQDFAWGTIEKSRRTFDFSYFDNYVAAAEQHGLVDPATNTADFMMTLAAGTPA